jgi:hypothetical protein
LSRLPWISRAHHEEVVGLLRSQLEAAEADRRKLLDYIQKLSIGEPIYEKPAPPETKEITAVDLLPKTEEQKRHDEVREAIIATGSRSVSVLRRYIESKRESNFKQRVEHAAGPEAVALAIDNAVREGAEAGKKKVQEMKAS